MSLARVQKQLIKDLKRSPLKAGVLGLLCVVALWFWAPLVTGWFGGSKGKAAKPQAAAAPPVPVATPTAAGGAAPAAASPSVPWRQLVAWMEKDPRKQSSELGVLESPPFPPQRADRIEEESKPAQTAAAKLELDPAQLGLKLSSTMLGPRRRVAVINGRPYAEGKEVEVAGEMVFLVARVTDRSVLLERNGRQFELVMSRDKGQFTE
jgi:hypothetical protein